jgi:CHAD domain-containing protein
LRPAIHLAAPRWQDGGEMTYRLSDDDTPSAGLRRSAQEELDDAIRQLTEGMDADPVIAVHEARKSLKKVRALLRLARRELGEETYARENAALRDAGRRLSDTRDADVMLQTFAELSKRAVGHVPQTTLSKVRQGLRGPRRRSRPAALRLLAGEVAEELRSARERSEEWRLERDDWRLVSRGLERAYARGAAAMPRGGRRPSVEDLHEWRKRVKDLWYHTRLLKPIWPDLLEATAEEAHRLSELLGDDHDLAVLRERLTTDELFTTGLPADLGPLIDVIDARREELLDEARLVGRRLYAEKPKAFTERMRRYWSAWRARVDRLAPVA